MRNIYLRLAVNAIGKNRAVYIPYILASSLMGMILYFMTALSEDETISKLRGGEDFEGIILIGAVLFVVFALIFIFYLSSYITGKRGREYNILSVLGMEKKHLLKLIFIENAILCGTSVLLSILGGLAFYKVVQLALTKILEGKLDYDFTVCWFGLGVVIAVYMTVYAAVYIVQLIRYLIRRRGSARIVDAPVNGHLKKSDLIIAVTGMILLVAAYAIALSIPAEFSAFSFLDATYKFAVASGLIIVSTFMLFSSGSVLILTLSKKRKNYYKKENFVNISSLIYRMRRNGIGLAAVCILSTMAIITTTALMTFYLSLNSYLKTIAPISLSVTSVDGKDETVQLQVVNKVVEDLKTEGLDDDLSVFAIRGQLDFLYNLSSDGTAREYEEGNNTNYNSYSIMIDKDSASSLLGRKLNLSSNQIGILYSSGNQYYMTKPIKKVITLDEKSYTPVYISIDPDFMDSIFFDDAIIVYPTGSEKMVDDYIQRRSDRYFEIMAADYLLEGDASSIREQYKSMVTNDSTYYISVSNTIDEQNKFFNDYIENDSEIETQGYILTSKIDAAVDFNLFFKAMMFLCFMLIVIFFIMTAMLIYYRNLFDGIEDLKNYEIMRKIGLDDDLINKVAVRQTMTTLLLPILVATIHTVFGERYVLGIISLFEAVTNRAYFGVAIVSVVVSICIYLIVGFIASRTYSRIVKGQRNVF